MSEQPDIHARLMSKYPQVPDWWYLIIFCKYSLVLTYGMILIIECLVAMFVFGIVTIEAWPTQMPVWAFVLALVRTTRLPRRGTVCS